MAYGSRDLYLKIEGWAAAAMSAAGACGNQMVLPAPGGAADLEEAGSAPVS